MLRSAQRWPSRRRLAVGYGVALLFLTLNVGVTVWNIRAITASWAAVDLTHRVTAELDSLLSDLKDAETGQRGYLLTGEEPYLEPYFRARSKLAESLARVRTLTANNGIRQFHARGIEATTEAKLAELEETIRLRGEQGLQAALTVVKTGRGKGLMDELRQKVAEMEAEENRAEAAAKVRMERGLRDTLLTFLLTSALSLALLLFVAYIDHKARHELKLNAHWLTTTLRSIGDAVIATDEEGRVSFLNPVAEALSGWRLEDAKGRPLDEVFCITNEETGDTVESPVAKVLREGNVVGLANHTVLTSKDGKRRPIEDSAAPIADGAVYGVVLVFRDASDAREAEARIRGSEERYRSLVAATTQTVWLSTADFSSTEILTGEDPIGLPDEAKAAGGWLDAIHPDDRERTRRAFLEAVRARSVYEVEHRVRTCDGAYRHYLARAVPLLDKAGNIREWIGTSNDITERRQAEEARERLHRELSENDERKDEFLAMLAHELRNPLAAMGNAVTLSSTSRLQEHIDWSMGVINRQIRHLTRLIDDLLDVSRISRGKIELRRDVLDLTPLIDSAVETSRPLVESRNHTLSVSLDRGNLWVVADPARLEQVVMNLLTNAAKYTDDGGDIWLTAECEGAEVVITVRDSGMGIPPEKVPEMFVLFAQGDRTLARSEGGLGIGLTLVKKLVEMHGGSVVGRSEGVGKGSEFIVRLPAAVRPIPAKPPAKASDDSPKHAARILVVDDNVDTAEGMAGLLRVLGHDVRITHEGMGAIAAARAFRPDFVLLDIGLPKMSGYEVAASLRQDEGCTGAVLIAVSGYGQDEDRRRSKEAGFDYHLVKPVDHDALLMLLSRAETA